MAFDSLFIGVTGLESYQSQIDTISNNIANVGTTGFKGQDVNFQDLIYQAQSFASAPTQTSGGINGQDAGLGVKIGSIDTNFAQGGLRTTGVNTNLAMNGDGFFILRKPNANGSPVYTRNGDFSLNSNGMLYDQSSGMAVQGYMADKNGNVNQTGTPADMTIPLGLSSQAVGTGLNANMKFGKSGDQVFDVSLGGNVDQTQWIKEAQGVQGGTPGTGRRTRSRRRSTTRSATRTSRRSPTRPTRRVRPPARRRRAVFPRRSRTPAACCTTRPRAGKSPSRSPTARRSTRSRRRARSQPAAPLRPPSRRRRRFRTARSATSTSIRTASTSTRRRSKARRRARTSPARTCTRTTARPRWSNGNQLNVRAWGTGNTNNSVAPTAGGPAPQTGPIGLDFGSQNSTSLAGTSTANVVAQNGFTAGILSNLTIGQDGTISGAFTNGQTTTLGRVAVATFQNEGGLQRVGGSDFAATANSGLAQVGTASVGRFGSIVSGSLEQSNVSIADEFTKMISAQNAYQANSKSITTASEDMQTVIALIR